MLISTSRDIQFFPPPRRDQGATFTVAKPGSGGRGAKPAAGLQTGGKEQALMGFGSSGGIAFNF